VSGNGFEVLRDVFKANAKAYEDELDDFLDRVNIDRPGFREGIPVELWRALPDSPGP
jgi:hypothetical protein